MTCDGQIYEVEVTIDARIQLAREEDLVRKVYFDELTGLPNRQLLERSVTAMIEAGSTAFALAFFDLDGFKNINDYCGPSIGDQLLARFSERLSSMLGPTDMLGRLSGDEFLLLLSPVDCRDELMEDIEQFSARLKEPFIVEGFEIFASASIGVSIYPDDGNSYDMLKINADRAMYVVKGALRFFDPSIDHAAAERSNLEQRLRLTIRDHRIVCAYQPKFDFRSGAISVGGSPLLATGPSDRGDPIARRRTRRISPRPVPPAAFTGASRRASRCRSGPPAPMRRSPRCAPGSSMSSPGRRGRWVWSCAPSASRGPG